MEQEPTKRAYKRPELVKFGRADRLTDGIVLPSLRDFNDR